MQKIKIVIASQNVGKIREIKEILGEEYEVLGKKEMGIEQEIEESAKDFLGNARLKAVGIFEALKEKKDVLVLSDDSGICVDALDGMPGVYSARYASLDPLNVQEENDAINRAHLISALQKKNLASSPARFVCAAVLYGNYQGRLINLHAQGECLGVVHDYERGEWGFGYDSLFEPLGMSQRMAELSPHQKNQISHRFKALYSLFEAWEKHKNLA
ncbi:non-canonical purine NTP pyrophosphatase [Helicobacter mustelae]|uniref:dITP/XTP pyrophosphatase n=1 Tax=Helicobacter mustelae (strain ATCC 43772 / CCUG 25715 / CIP 103759 / LMG 18044 / NCTC 12198 / R85-136P) TaxID=679897 RepID=D3UI90_HELM1|nr:non-canonical purine NTP pyrophosphatase [Helicobacter mustelae]CBG40213.1 Putative HAM1-like protein [Helicobacter mustelae 12198]SQH71713.1 HAM1-like protein [Helicobacter mustelae]